MTYRRRTQPSVPRARQQAMYVHMYVLRMYVLRMYVGKSSSKNTEPGGVANAYSYNTSRIRGPKWALLCGTYRHGRYRCRDCILCSTVHLYRLQ